VKKCEDTITRFDRMQRDGRSDRRMDRHRMTAWAAGAANAGGVGKNRDAEPISGFIAYCQRYDRQVLSTRCHRTVTSCDTYRW